MNWLARRRIAISLIGFTSLIGYNVAIARTRPLNPLDLSDYRTAVALALVLVGLAIRSWSAGTLNKSRELTTKGPYSLTRNPLYVGSFALMFGFCVLCKDLPTFLFVAGPMFLVYWVQIRFEEVRLNRLFPEQWPSYEQRVARILPLSPKQLPKIADLRQGWTVAEWLRNREYRGVLATAGGVLAIVAWYYAMSA